jgi:hypothetical protein
MMSETFLTLRRNEGIIIINVGVGLRVRCPLFSSDFIENRIFSTDFQKVFKHQFSLKKFYWKPSSSMRTDGQIDMTKLIVASRNFTSALKNCSQGNVRDICRPRSTLVCLRTNLETEKYAVKVRCNIKDIKYSL